MNDDAEKVCPECGGEYQETAEVCVDCGVPLVLPGEIAERDARELRLTPGLALLCTAPIQWVRALAADLAQAGIPYGIDRRAARSKGLLSLYVRQEDREAAATLDATRMRIDPIEADDEPEEEVREEPAPAPDHKVCPRCGGEYRLDITRCADCGVDLVMPGEEKPTVEEDPEELYNEIAEREEAKRRASVLPDPPRHEIPASDDLVCLCCGFFSILAALSPALDDAGIGHRIEPAPYKRNDSDGCLYLRPEDCAAAERIWNAANYTEDGFPAEGRTCPACGSSLPARVPACPDCGLGLAFAAYTSCPDCGAILIGSVGWCPNCESVVAEP
jgi:predicted amidophosphoribosyltransferase